MSFTSIDDVARWLVSIWSITRTQLHLPKTYIPTTTTVGT